MKYTPHDLEEMRTLILDSRRGSYKPEDIERELLTHMMNETTVADLEAYRDQKVLEARREREWYRAVGEIKRRLCRHKDWGVPERPGWHRHRSLYYSGLDDVVPYGFYSCVECGQIDRRKEARDEKKGKKKQND